MTSADLLNTLVETTLASSAATLLVLLLRRPLRRAFGAGAAYAAWSLVPAAVVAVLLPAAAIPLAGEALVTMPVLVVAAGPAQVVPDALDALDAAGIAWLSGCLVLAASFARQQWRFVRSLGRVEPRGDGLYQAEASIGLPAAIGSLRPRIVLPADFASRYSPEQQLLMEAHESVHVARGDLLANLLVAGLRCAFWFNPLLHYAAWRFRHDQELACDQRVIARHPRARHAYGEAMFKTQFAAQSLPLGCHWGHGHPLKERIEMLKRPVPTLKRMLVGTALVSALVSGGAYAAWASQPGAGDEAKPAASPDMPSEIAAASPPEYPQDALAQGIGGMVVLHVDLDAQGRPTKVDVDKSEPQGVFDAAAIEAVRKWRFNPAIEGGKPVASRIAVPISFDPEGDPDKRVKDGVASPAVRLSKAGDGTRWSSYDRMVRSLSASWEKPAAPADEC